MSFPRSSEHQTSDNSQAHTEAEGALQTGQSTRITLNATANDAKASDTDLEAAKACPSTLVPALQEKPATATDPNLVDWDGPDDPENPRNWSIKRKWTATILVSCFTFISPVSSTFVAPALSNIGDDLGITTEVVLELCLSIFVLAYALGPLVVGPLSEIYGRKIILQTTNLWYIVFNVACGVAQTTGQMIAFRFLAGLGGGAPQAKRGKAMAIYSLAPLLGPALGPIAGGFVAERTTWRWVFYSTTIAAGAIQLAAFFLLPETYAPIILQRRARKLRKETGNMSLQTEVERQNKKITQVLRVALIRPLKLLFTQPIVQIIALYMAYAYGLMYLMLATFPTLWASPDYYDESKGIAGLNYISLGIGFIAGTQVCARMLDRFYRLLKARNNEAGRPEFRLPMLAVGAFCTPAGLFIYGWTAQTHQHWIAPNIGACIFGIGCMITMQCLQIYTVDTYTRFSASALAAIVLLRSLAGFSFPLFAPYLFQALKYGWGNSVLAFIAIGIGVPAPALLWVYGQRLRAASPFAAG
ncbi:MFS multidrug transporter [Penicillium chermesinum]|uniref:MFS multidrug transporter n=1 Tax=Penicillium chermesinum TaxID=63820 RepID=A0A9W9TYZ5_9EURO|nr:MFS multidrug transporter [Penicillium chermesinum]KAJ5249109.1 MFS multidrug transporter [Penicillium chermesinum]